MSNHVLFVKPGFIRNNAPLLNGIGRFIPQLMRVTFKFCKESGDSHGMRQFIEHDVVKFAEKNPHCAIYLKPRRRRQPLIVAEYLNGHHHHQHVSNHNIEQIRGWVDILRTHSGKEFQTQLKDVHTDFPSIQGMWNPYVNEEPEVSTTQFPSTELASRKHQDISASDKLLQMFREQQEQKAAGNENNPASEQVLESSKQ